MYPIAESVHSMPQSVTVAVLAVYAVSVALVTLWVAREWIARRSVQRVVRAVR